MAEEIPYCTRESVQKALGFADSARLNQRIDDAILAASGTIHGFLHRQFLPYDGTFRFDMPETDILWLYDRELAAAPTAVTSGGTAMTSGVDYLLKPASGPPYRWIEERTAGSVKWQSDDTWQESIAITGTFFYPCRQQAVTLLNGQINATTDTLIVDDSAPFGVGSLLLIDSERLLVTERTYVDTTADLAADLTASKAQTSVPVSNGWPLVADGETILIDSERMTVLSVVGNTLTVERAAGGSVLAAHTSGAGVSAPRSCTVTRGARGTAAASHLENAVVSTLRAQQLVETLARAIAMQSLGNDSAGYARSQGSGENARTPGDGGLTALMEAAYTSYGRKTRTRAVM